MFTVPLSNAAHRFSYHEWASKHRILKSETAWGSTFLRSLLEVLSIHSLCDERKEVADIDPQALR